MLLPCHSRPVGKKTQGREQSTPYTQKPVTWGSQKKRCPSSPPSPCDAPKKVTNFILRVPVLSLLLLFGSRNAAATERPERDSISPTAAFHRIVVPARRQLPVLTSATNTQHTCLSPVVACLVCLPRQMRGQRPFLVPLPPSPLPRLGAARWLPPRGEALLHQLR